MSSTSSDDERELSDDTDCVLIEMLEAHIDKLKAENNELKHTIESLRERVKTFQCIVKSDIIAKICQCV
jgi:cell division protein FtsB